MGKKKKTTALRDTLPIFRPFATWNSALPREKKKCPVFALKVFTYLANEKSGFALSCEFIIFFYKKNLRNKQKKKPRGENSKDEIR